MSTLKDKLKMAAESVGAVAFNIANGEDVTISEKDFRARMAECQKCPSWNRPLNQCEECGCFLALKGRLAGQKCPLNKWKA